MDILEDFNQLSLQTFQDNLSSAQALFPWRPSLMRDRLDHAYVSLLALSARRYNGLSTGPALLRSLDIIVRTMNDAADEIEKRLGPPPLPQSVQESPPKKLAETLRQNATTLNNLIREYRPQPL